MTNNKAIEAKELILKSIENPYQYREYVMNKLAGDFACAIAAILPTPPTSEAEDE